MVGWLQSIFLDNPLIFAKQNRDNERNEIFGKKQQKKTTYEETQTKDKETEVARRKGTREAPTYVRYDSFDSAFRNGARMSWR